MRIFSGLGGKLLLAFSLMALLTLGASLLGSGRDRTLLMKFEQADRL
ncbi:hypothetical protein [Aeromonas caviae]|nr:hypothetical protein [Aeromonas caviae]MXQ70908.1 hypothetical protein [Aeromonas caviae]